MCRGEGLGGLRYPCEGATDFAVIRADKVEDGVSSGCVISKTGESMLGREERRFDGERVHGRMVECNFYSQECVATPN